MEEEKMITAEEYLKKKCVPYQKTFEPDGDNLYVEMNMVLMMKEYARVACEEQRRLCTVKYLMVNGSDTEEEMKAIEEAPEPEVLNIPPEYKY